MKHDPKRETLTAITLAESQIPESTLQNLLDTVSEQKREIYHLSNRVRDLEDHRISRDDEIKGLEQSFQVLKSGFGKFIFSCLTSLDALQTESISKRSALNDVLDSLGMEIRGAERTRQRVRLGLPSQP